MLLGRRLSRVGLRSPRGFRLLRGLGLHGLLGLFRLFRLLYGLSLLRLWSRLNRSRTGGDRRIAMVVAGPQRRIGARRLLLLSLGRSDFNVVLARGRRLGGRGLGSNAATATVIAHASDIDVVDHRFVVHIRNVDTADIDDGSVVEDMSALPVGALVAYAGIAKSIVDAAVETDLRT